MVRLDPLAAQAAQEEPPALLQVAPQADGVDPLDAVVRRAELLSGHSRARMFEWRYGFAPSA
jgi:hypothetical protein